MEINHLRGKAGSSHVLFYVLHYSAKGAVHDRWKSLWENISAYRRRAVRTSAADENSRPSAV